MKKNRNLFIAIFSLSIFLMGLAFFTVDYSLSMPTAPAKSMEWDLGYKNFLIKKGLISNVVVNNDQIDFNVVLSNPGDEAVLLVELENNGDYNAVLNEIDLKGLDVSAGTTKEGYTYFYKDYVDYSINYESENPSGLAVNADVEKYDVLNKGDKKTIIITLRYKSDDELTQEMKSVLESEIIDLDILVKTVFGQKK